MNRLPHLFEDEDDIKLHERRITYFDSIVDCLNKTNKLSSDIVKHMSNCLCAYDVVFCSNLKQMLADYDHNSVNVHDNLFDLRQLNKQLAQKQK